MSKATICVVCISDTLVSLITVEAQSYGPNSLVGIKVVEYCPPPHLTGGSTDGLPGAVGPPSGQQPTQGQPAQPAATPKSKALFVYGLVLTWLSNRVSHTSTCKEFIVQ